MHRSRERALHRSTSARDRALRPTPRVRRTRARRSRSRLRPRARDSRPTNARSIVDAISRSEVPRRNRRRTSSASPDRADLDARTFGKRLLRHGTLDDEERREKRAARLVERVLRFTGDLKRAPRRAFRFARDAFRERPRNFWIHETRERREIFRSERCERHASVLQSSGAFTSLRLVAIHAERRAYCAIATSIGSISGMT